MSARKFIVASLMILSLVLSACGALNQTPAQLLATDTPVPAASTTPRPTKTPVKVESGAGSDENVVNVATPTGTGIPNGVNTPANIMPGAQKSYTLPDGTIILSRGRGGSTNMADNVPLGWDVEWYRSPFRQMTREPADKLALDVFGEPGVLPGEKLPNGDYSQTAWDKMDDEVERILVPEGGWTYTASNAYCTDVVNPEASDMAGYEVKDHIACLPKLGETLYLTFYTGLPADAGDVDFNRFVDFYGYTKAAAINHVLPLGAYVSYDWTLQQIVNGWEPQVGLEDPQCGDNGCDNVYVVVHNLQTMTTRIWKVGSSPTDWIRVTSWDQLQ